MAALLLLCGSAQAQNEWRRLPGAANDIGVGADGSVWVIGVDNAPGGHGIYRFNGSNGWDKVNGGAVRIAVEPNGNPWVVNASGGIFRWAGNGQWITMPGGAKDIGIGANGSVWVIGFDIVPGGNSIYRFNGQGWDRVPGGAVRISVDPAGNAWVVSDVGIVYSWNGSAFVSHPGLKAKDISVGGDAVFAVDEFGRLHRYSSNGWAFWGDSARGMDARYNAVAVDGDGLPWLVGAHGEIVSRNGGVIDAFTPPAATALDAGFIASGIGAFAEKPDGQWDFILAYGVTAMRELQRNETSIQLKVTSGADTSFLVDFQKRAVFRNLAGDGAGSPITAASTVTGNDVTYIDLTLHDPATGHLMYRTVLTQNFTNGESTGWTLDTGGQRKSLATDAVIRSSGGVYFWGHVKYDVNTLTRQCTAPGYVCRVARLESVTGHNVGQFTLRMGGQLYTLTHTHATLGLWQLSGTSPAEKKAWEEKKRTLDYVEFKSPDSAAIPVRLYLRGSSENVMPAGFGVKTGAPVVGSRRHWKGQLGTIPVPLTPGISPGFQIQNKTDYPVLVTLEQVGCLYYEIVQPGQVFQRNTGSVYFTIRASMAPNLESPTEWSCARDPLLYGAAVAVSAFATVATAGVGTGFALMVPAIIFNAAGRGAAIATEHAVQANGGSKIVATAANYGVVMLTSGAAYAGVAMLNSSGANHLVVGQALMDAATGLPLAGALLGAEALITHVAQQKDIDAIRADLVQEAVVVGAWAGWDWPAPMSWRVMPRFDITGGPHIKTLSDGSIVVLKQQHPLRITRVN
jgi:hypothetical protein